MQEESEYLDILFAEMSALECTHNGCTEGEGGARFKTQALAPQHALEYLKLHIEGANGRPLVGAGGGANKARLGKIPRPDISGGCSQEDFKFFTRKWNQYVRTSNVTEDTLLKDERTNCPDTALRSALNKSMGDRVETISVADLLREIEVLAVVRQSNNVNMLALINAKQERDEPVRQFAARLRGLAAVCDLSVTCSCGLKVSEVDKWVWMSLIGGLNDEDTKQSVLTRWRSCRLTRL